MNETIPSRARGGAGSHPVDRAARGVGHACSAAVSLFVVWTTLAGRYPNWIQYEVVLALVLGAVFALSPGPLRRVSPVLDVALSAALAAAGVITALYMIEHHHEIAAFREGIPNAADLTVYVVGTLLVLEATRRAEGPLLLSVVLLGIAYLLAGPILPGILGHRGLGLAEVAELAYSQSGIFGVALGSVVEIVYVFVIFGAALRIVGAGEFFDWIAGRLTMGRRSGSAQCAIVASALFGSINGSAPANVVANGAITINMMHGAGFSRAYAGAVEASSSVVGQIMPPVMGVGAFIMAEITGIPYGNIMLAAVAPSLLFLLSLSAATALEAGKLGLAPAPVRREPWTRARAAQATTIVAAFAVLLGMLFAGYSVDLCGLGALVAVVAVAMLFPETRLRPRALIDVLVEGGREGVAVAAACAAIGIVIGAVSATGLGVKLGQAILDLGRNSLPLALVAAALCSLLLGMGLPTAASYLLVIFVAGPAMIDLGLPVLTAHLFVFYFAVMSAITPPVALAVFAAAAIAQEPVMRIALIAVRLCLVAFLFPFLWVYQPDLLLQDLSGPHLARAVLGLAALAAAVIMLAVVQTGYFRGRLTRLERGLLAAASALVFVPGALTTTIGTVAGAAILGRRWYVGGRSLTAMSGLDRMTTP
ncbi:MAG TPA: TRAP transporter fused permease subunit [Thermodesulfobacteriota bacterium]